MGLPVNAGFGGNTASELRRFLDNWISIMQPQVHHYAWTTEETIAQVHGIGPWGLTYVNPADDPSKKTN